MPHLDTIDNYMAKLHTIILDSPQENDALIASVRDIVGRLNFDRLATYTYCLEPFQH